MRLGKNRNTFIKAFLTLHYRGFESRLGEKTENFFWKIFCSYYLLEVNSRFGRKLLNLLSSLANGHEKCVWAKKSETFLSFFCFLFPLEARCLSGPLFGSFFFFTYMGKMSTPSLPLPTGGKAAVWTKKVNCYPNLFLTDLSGQEKVNWPKNLKTEKTALSQKRLCDRAAWCWKIHDCVI